MPVLMYGSEIMIWEENERSRIKAVQMDKLRGLLCIRRTDKVPNGVTKVTDERLRKVFSGGSAMLREWRMTRLLRGSMWDCVGSSSLGRPRKRWIDTMKD